MKKFPIKYNEWIKVLQDWKKGENLKDVYVYHTGYVSNHGLILEAFNLGIIINIEEFKPNLNKLSFDQELK